MCVCACGVMHLVRCSRCSIASIAGMECPAVSIGRTKQRLCPHLLSPPSPSFLSSTQGCKLADFGFAAKPSSKPNGVLTDVSIEIEGREEGRHPRRGEGEHRRKGGIEGVPSFLRFLPSFLPSIMGGGGHIFLTFLFLATPPS